MMTKQFQALPVTCIVAIKKKKTLQSHPPQSPLYKIQASSYTKMSFEAGMCGGSSC